MTPPEKRKLYLVVDNAPEEKTLPVHDRLEAKYRKKYQRLLKKEKGKLEQKITETEQKIEDELNATYMSEIKKQRKRYLLALGLGIGATIMASAAYSTVNDRDSEPAIINCLDEDLNHDGVPDAYIIQQNNHKVPMYGVKEHGRIRYVGRREIEYYTSTYTNYQDIEDKLNR